MHDGIGFREIRDFFGAWWDDINANDFSKAWNQSEYYLHAMKLLSFSTLVTLYFVSITAAALIPERSATCTGIFLPCIAGLSDSCCPGLSCHPATPLGVRLRLSRHICINRHALRFV